MLRNYDETKNYIGSTKTHLKYTKKIKENFQKINYISFCHDTMYLLSFQFNSKILFIISKVILDLYFLVAGSIHCLFSKNIIKGIIGMFIIIIFYLLILIYTPVYTYNYFKNRSIE
jgi:hypothetical protein